MTPEEYEEWERPTVYGWNAFGGYNDVGSSSSSRRRRRRRRRGGNGNGGGGSSTRDHSLNLMWMYLPLLTVLVPLPPSSLL